MYKNGFVLSVKNQENKTLRENNARQVFIPFYSEYKLYLKNTHNRRAVVSIEIDGTEILGKNELIVEPNSFIDLERFVIDGNLNSGKRFKFVPLSDSRVQDKTSTQNGLIIAKFRLEKLLKYTTSNNSITIRKVKLYDDDESFKIEYNQFPANNKTFQYPNTYYCSTRIPTAALNMANNERGATIEGAESNQKFNLVNAIDLETEVTELTLQILAPIENLTTIETKKKYCTSCGKRLKFKDNFCSKCGVKQY